MKNVLIFISPTKSFDNPRHDVVNDFAVSIKVQIENSLALGWKEIALYTNFPYEYKGVKATVLDAPFFERKPQASKINAILKLFETMGDETYWFHDLDAFQIGDVEIDLGNYAMALTDYGRNTRWSTGVIYFKKSAEDIFIRIRNEMYKKNIDEERALTFLTRTDEEIEKRVLKINKSYNFTPKNLKTMYGLALKPIRVLHFHPLGAIGRLNAQRSFYFFRGDNKINIKFIPEQLLKIFEANGVT